MGTRSYASPVLRQAEPRTIPTRRSLASPRNDPLAMRISFRRIIPTHLSRACSWHNLESCNMPQIIIVPRHSASRTPWPDIPGGFSGCLGLRLEPTNGSIQRSAALCSERVYHEGPVNLSQMSECCPRCCPDASRPSRHVLSV